jgi:hypothetical protein
MTNNGERGPLLVRQEHPNGCGLACIAMVTGLGYGEVRDTLTEFLPRERDYGEEGIHHGITEWFLGRLGYAWRTLYAGHLHDPWPPEPFAPVHIAQVRQPSGNTHYVVVTDDGTVLDPLDGERKRLDVWDVPDGKFSGVNSVMGLWRVSANGGSGGLGDTAK